jgi:hypothetical protein
MQQVRLGELARKNHANAEATCLLRAQRSVFKAVFTVFI